MSLRPSRRCLDIVARAAGGSNSLFRPGYSTLVVQHRCYSTPAAAQKVKEKPAAHATASPSTSRKAGKALTPSRAARESTESERTTEDEIRGVELLHHMTETNQMDINSSPLELLDVHIPTWRSYKEGATLVDHMRAVYMKQRNWFLNARAMYRIAQDQSIPGVKVKSAWSLQLFAAQSTRPTAWLAPFRQAALEVYKRINEAVAARDEKAIKDMTAGEQQLAYTKLIRSQDPRYINVWKFHGERTPCKVVSIRALEAYYGTRPPRIGSRLAIQAVVRFDTLQSIETYSKKTGARVRETEPKPVVEYLVFQKRMWYDSPWVIRDRLYEGLESRFTIPQA